MFLEKAKEIDKLTLRLNKRKKKDYYITNIRNKERAITTGTIDTKKIMRTFRTPGCHKLQNVNEINL